MGRDVFLKKETLTVTRFDLGQGFFVDVTPCRGEVAFWLGHRDCDVMERMFALSAPFAPQERWESLIEADKDDYMADFREAWLEE